MKVAVIGAAGKMGAWFCAYFARHGHDVAAFDVKPFSINRVARAKSVGRCVKDADLVTVCVPVKRTPAVIAQCARSMKAGASLAEISSVKHETLPVLKKTDDITTLCVHPMFGPGASEKKQLRMLAVPVHSKVKELAAIKRAFPGMLVKVLPDAKTHDRAIAAVLGLTYFANVAFASLLAKENLAMLKQVGGTTFAVQSMLAESVMTDEPELAVALMRGNPHAKEYMLAYLKEAGALAKAGDRALAEKLASTKKGLQKKTDITASYRRMYQMLQKA